MKPVVTKARKVNRAVALVLQAPHNLIQDKQAAYLVEKVNTNLKMANLNASIVPLVVILAGVARHFVKNVLQDLLKMKLDAVVAMNAQLERCNQVTEAQSVCLVVKGMLKMLLVHLAVMFVLQVSTNHHPGNLAVKAVRKAQLMIVKALQAVRSVVLGLMQAQQAKVLVMFAHLVPIKMPADRSLVSHVLLGHTKMSQDRQLVNPLLADIM